MRKYLCFDFGGTFVKYAIIDEKEQILIKDQFPTICEDYQGFMDSILQVYQRYDFVEGIGISMPGLLDVEQGYAYTGGAITCLGSRNVASEISRLCGGVSVVIENDAKAAAYAELKSGSLKECNNGVVIVIGTALGGTVVVDRKILRGRNLFAGEFSYIYYSNEHMTDLAFGDCDRKHEKDGRGLFTDRCTPKRICQLYSAMTGEDVDVTRCPEIFQKARQGDKAAESAIETCCRDLAMLAFNLQCVLDPDVIAIGGGISNDPLFVELLKKEVLKYADHVVPGAPVPNISACTYGSDANLLGAYYSFRDRYSGDK